MEEESASYSTKEGSSKTTLQLDSEISPEGKRLRFIYKLFQILEKEACSDIVSWLPHGKAFAIFDKRRFETEIMPIVLESNAKYPSFIRRLLRWNFKQVNDGATGLFANPHFQRACPHLLRQLRSKESKLGKLEQRLLQQSALLQRSAVVPEQISFTNPAMAATKNFLDAARKSTLERLHQLDVMSTQLEARRMQSVGTPPFSAFPSSHPLQSGIMNFNQRSSATNKDIRNMIHNSFTGVGPQNLLASNLLANRSFSKHDVAQFEKMRLLQASMKLGMASNKRMGSGDQAHKMTLTSMSRFNSLTGAGFGLLENELS